MDVGSGFERVVGPLRLRRPTEGDRDAYVRLHTDPRTYAHAPESMPDRLGCRIRLDADLDHWRDNGFGYLAVEETATGEVVGWTGVRRFPEHDALNLYYRLSHDRLGLGYGRLLARSVTVSATEWLPDEVVRASVRVTNPGSLRTALAAGLVRIGLDERGEPEGTPPSDLLELPRVEAVDTVTPGLRDRLAELCVRNGDGPGSGTSTGAGVEAVLDDLSAQIRDGRAVLGVLREPGGFTTGFGLCVLDDDRRHSRVVPLQVDPDRRERNHEELLLAGLRALGRREGA